MIALDLTPELESIITSAALRVCPCCRAPFYDAVTTDLLHLVHDSNLTELHDAAIGLAIQRVLPQFHHEQYPQVVQL
jgi:hypothetical protein